MKKQLLLIGLIFGMFIAYSQEVTKKENTTEPAQVEENAEQAEDVYCPHRLQLYLGAGYSNDFFTKDEDFPIDFQKKFSYTSMFRVGYAYLWHRKVNIGIGIGAGLAYTRPQVKYNDTKTKLVNDIGYEVANDEATYFLTYSANDFKVRQKVWAVEVPLTMQLEKKFGNQKNGIYFNVGVKGYFPFAANLVFPGGQFDLKSIYDKNLNVEMDDLDVHLDPVKLDRFAVKTKMRCSIDVIGELGGVFGISRNTDIYLGVYASYGFLNVYPKEKIELNDLNLVDPRISQITNDYINKKDKWNMLQIGLKVGFHFLPCKECGNNEYMKDHRKRYRDKMMAKKDEPIIITNTVTEYYYIVPTIAQELLDESANDPAKKKALQELAQSLSNIKILFDLDKDIPKLDDSKKENIKRAAELLRQNPDFKVIVTGYTSPEGSNEHNRNLGNRRAVAVRQHFVNEGVPADQIAVQNFTAEDPQHKLDIPDKDYKEQRAVIFKIEKK